LKNGNFQRYGKKTRFTHLTLTEVNATILIVTHSLKKGHFRHKNLGLKKTLAGA
jgi:hypothetical protein